MRKDIVIGLDTAKRFIQLCAMTRDGELLDERRLVRDKMLAHVSKLERCTVALEACGGSHYWGRELLALGFRVRLLHPAHVRPYVGVQKNDRADARAICEAALRPLIRSVPIKSRDQQDMRVLLRLRQALVSERTRLINRFRGLLGEYGLVLPKGAKAFRRRLRELIGETRWQEALSARVRDIFQQLAGELDRLFAKAEDLKQQIVGLQQGDETAQRLRTIPGVGPVIAAEVMASIEDARVFASGRNLAAWVGLVPRQNSTGGRTRLGRITKRGQGELRRLLVQGARSLINASKRNKGPARHQLEAWLRKHQGRLHDNVLATALANKIARTLWVVMARGETFKPVAPNRAPA